VETLAAKKGGTRDSMSNKCSEKKTQICLQLKGCKWFVIRAAERSVSAAARGAAGGMARPQAYRCAMTEAMVTMCPRPRSIIAGMPAGDGRRGPTVEGVVLLSDESKICLKNSALRADIRKILKEKKNEIIVFLLKNLT